MTTYPTQSDYAFGRRTPLSADYMRTVQLKTTGVLGRAYDPTDVRNLLRRVADDIDTRNKMLAARDRDLARARQRISDLEEELDYRKHGRLPNAIKDEIPPDALEARREAQREADRMIASAQRSAAEIAKTARLQAERMLAHAAERSDSAALGYRRRVQGGVYSADREEVERMLAVLDWLLEIFGTSKVQFGAYHDATMEQLRKVRGRLDPAVDAAADRAPAVTG